ncbi:MAG: DUF3426 domain-containing protein [Steroidobacteraceae bacterium]
MYTQCAKCETVFKLSAEVLRAAGGQVRCGRCGEVFNALARLAEDASAFSTGESPLDMEARADRILQSPADSAVSAVLPALSEAAAPQEAEDLTATDVEFARLQVLDLPAETSLEFTLPPGELDRIFVEPKPRTRQSAASSTAATSTAATSTAAGDAVARSVETKMALPSRLETLEAPHDRIVGLEVSADVQREMLVGYEEAKLSDLTAPRVRGLPFAAWLTAAFLLALLLGAQIVHQNRQWFAAHVPADSRLRPLYGWLGVALPAPANLSAYQLRQWGVTGDPSANGTLRVRASILNTAAQLQPYPLLRVTLANRFGAALGARDFEPAEYLGKPTVRMLAPGERVDATLDILDPGKDAEGFEIDVCLRGADQKVACAADAATQAKQ